jgi:hypothetical protein
MVRLNAYEPEDELKSRPLYHRAVPILTWLPAMTSSLAWKIAFGQLETCQGTKAE